MVEEPDDYVDEVLDPRIQGQLEELNAASNQINVLENELSEKRNQHRIALSESTQMLNQLSKKLGDCVAKARPYYEARRINKQAQLKTQQAAVRFERAVSMHSAAREMVSVAEQGMQRDNNRQDAAWQDMLNHATLKVNDAEIERMISDAEHQALMNHFKQTEATVNKLERKLKSSIIKSRRYFETKAVVQSKLEDLVSVVHDVEKRLKGAKIKYSDALRMLESISNSIHQSRKLRTCILGERGRGVGAEAERKSDDIDGQSTSHYHEHLSVDRSVSDSSSLRTVISDLQKYDSTEQIDKLSDSFSAINVDSSYLNNNDEKSQIMLKSSVGFDDISSGSSTSSSDESDNPFESSSNVDRTAFTISKALSSPIKSPCKPNNEILLNVASLSQVTPL